LFSIKFPKKARIDDKNQVGEKKLTLSPQVLLQGEPDFQKVENGAKIQISLLSKIPTLP